MYKEIVELRPYFHSLREIKNNVSLDIKLPISWEINYSIDQFPSTNFKEQDKNETTKLISFIADNTENGYNDAFNFAKHVIIFNIEKEKKQHLLEEKIKELKKLFQEKDLELLENLKFEELYERERTEGIGLSDSEGYTEDSEGDNDVQEGPN